MIKSVIFIYKKEGLINLLIAIYGFLFPMKAKAYSLIKEIVSAGKGLEVGGLSSIFQQKNVIPIYTHIKLLDNCNFASHTVWEGNISEGLKYFYDEAHAPGRQYVLEATDLNQIESETYDFLLSSHMIEHTANPIKALKEWMRVVEDGGHLIVLVPHKDGTFDHKHPVTTLDHLIQDYENDVTEKDLTHMSEILELHDLSRDLEAGTHQQFSERSEKNYENRCWHHHVFNSPLVAELMDYLNLQIKAIEAIAPMHILVVVQKLSDNNSPNNESFLEHVRSDKYKSPFSSDKL
ncbi:methyltransferase domain-containing protein [Sulfurimonas sp.]|uniref:methyltransferase domain-containing protein n=1 Tax=Sulfurimonas sp. TaxID=2022749 RepID=UPI0019E1E6DB|nr:methyltransferase domain-containing protein [Sulfurimonas sp.]MBE0515560.1 methyltransferase domain-containing protein [Sulfurimonas sp.]